MSKNLVIVESPAKAKTIKRFLGSNYTVSSCFGHISDLPKEKLGIDVENNFIPKYIVPDDKKEIIANLKKKVKNVDIIWLASDEDREGEAIAWHLTNVLKLDKKKTKRIIFNEITKSAILKSIENPRNIDINLVNAQQARRVLDRLVGYSLSPILWTKVKKGLSAGRVQSVAVKLIVDREEEIKSFKPQPYFRTQGFFLTEDNKKIQSFLSTDFEIPEDIKSFLKKNKPSTNFIIEKKEVKQTKKSPSPPFTTSSLQQEAARKLNFNVGKTMQLAQRLYESGLITYMRTDSVNISKEFRESCKKNIIALYGEKYSKMNVFTKKIKRAEEAHEAIRPTDITKTSIQVDYDQSRLYNLIWKRAMASQMSNAILEKTQLKIVSDSYKEFFIAKGEVIIFDGFLKVYSDGTDKETEKDSGLLPFVKEKDRLYLNQMVSTQRFTKPLPRYNEAMLVKKMEELGIGRPSTYAPTISTIQNRSYVVRGTNEGKERKYIQFSFNKEKIEEKILLEKTGGNKGKLVPTDVGIIVNNFLTNNFKSILDYNFTAKVEENFDQIAKGEENWTKMIANFYERFNKNVENVKEKAERESGERILGKDPDTKKVVKVRLGRFGPIAQIGEQNNDEKPIYASLTKEQTLNEITLEQALELFKFPKNLGIYKEEEVIINSGKYGPYIKYKNIFISIPKIEDHTQIDLLRAIELIKEKEKSLLPIYHYKELPVIKGVGRFGPFLKWNKLFISVSKKYNFDKLSDDDIVRLIEEKIKKEKEKVIHNWTKEGIRVEKSKWGRSLIIKENIKVELPKSIDPKTIDLDTAKNYIKEKTK